MSIKTAFTLIALAVTANADPDNALLRQQLAKRVGVPVYWKAQNPLAAWKVRCEQPAPADEKLLTRYLAIAVRELGAYPKSLVRKANLKAIVIVKNLSVAGQRRSAMPDYQNEILYLDFQRGAHSSVYQAHVIHHEFFHLLEQELN